MAKKSTTFKGQVKPYGQSGHFHEPMRHSLQARGIKTGRRAHLYRVWSYFSDPSNGDRREDRRVRAYDIDDVMDYMKKEGFKPEFRDKVEEGGDDQMAFLSVLGGDGDWVTEEGYQIEVDDGADAEFKTIYGTNDFVDLTGKKPKKAPDYDKELKKAWDKDPQEGADMLMKKTLKNINEKVDTDEDGVPDAKDCKPLDPTKQDAPKKGKQPIGRLSTSAFSGIDVYDVDYGIDDKVKFKHTYDGKGTKMLTSKIRYDEEGKPYFVTRGEKYYMDEFMRV